LAASAALRETDLVELKRVEELAKTGRHQEAVDAAQNLLTQISGREGARSSQPTTDNCQLTTAFSQLSTDNCFQDADPSAAEKALLAVLELDPEHTEAKRNLAVLRRRPPAFNCLIDRAESLIRLCADATLSG
jgi:hypothetical protein